MLHGTVTGRKGPGDDRREPSELHEHHAAGALRSAGHRRRPNQGSGHPPFLGEVQPGFHLTDVRHLPGRVGQLVQRPVDLVVRRLPPTVQHSRVNLQQDLDRMPDLFPPRGPQASIRPCEHLPIACPRRTRPAGAAACAKCGYRRILLRDSLTGATMNGSRLVIPESGEQPWDPLLRPLLAPGERETLLFPFLEEGLRRGDKCLCLTDDMEAALVRDRASWGQPGRGHARRSTTTPTFSGLPARCRGCCPAPRPR